VEFRSEKESFEFRFEVIDSKFVARKNWLPYATEKEWLAYAEKHKDPSSTRVIEQEDCRVDQGLRGRNLQQRGVTHV